MSRKRPSPRTLFVVKAIVVGLALVNFYVAFLL